MDIYLDGIALKQVLNLNFLQLRTAQRLTVPLTQGGCGHQFDVVHQQAVSHVGLLQFLHLGGRNDDGLHIPVVQHINQRIVVREHLDTHHHLIDKFRFVRNESAQTVVVAQIDTQCLGNVDPGFLGTVNEHIGTMGAVEVQRLEESLDNHTGACHHGKADDIGHEQHADRSQVELQIAFRQDARYHQQCIRHRQ